MPLVKVSSLQHPKLYVRSNINDVKIKDLLDLARNNKDEKRKLVWPFPNIEVAKDGKKFEILDGNRRTKVAKALKFDEIPANIREIKNPGERFLFQIQSNLHGMMLDKDQRDNSIRVLNEKFKMNLEGLAKAFKLTKASISRILAKKQRKEGPRKKGEEKENPKDNGKAEDFSTKNFMERTLFISEEYSKHQEDVSTYLQTLKQPNKEQIKAMVANLNSLAIMLESFLGGS